MFFRAIQRSRIPISIFNNKTETSAVYLLKLQKTETEARGAHNFLLFTINGIVIMSAKLFFSSLRQQTNHKLRIDFLNMTFSLLCSLLFFQSFKKPWEICCLGFCLFVPIAHLCLKILRLQHLLQPLLLRLPPLPLLKNKQDWTSLDNFRPI